MGLRAVKTNRPNVNKLTNMTGDPLLSVVRPELGVSGGSETSGISSKGYTTTPENPSQVLVNYYKCPETFCKIELTGELSKNGGFFRFGHDTLCYGKCHSASPASRPDGAVFDVCDAVELKQGSVKLPFDLTEVVNNLRYERYVSNAEPLLPFRLLKAAIRKTYYLLRPWMPVSVRKHLQRIRLSDWRSIPFPQWPVDYTVETILEKSLILCMKAQGLSSMPFIWFWPGGAQSCAIMTHDVETSAGVGFCRELMRLDDSFKIKSSFQVVPEERYVVSSEFLQEIRVRGFELNVQDLNHDGNLFTNRVEFLRRAHRINAYLGQFGATGFRSAIMYRNSDWLESIDASYDMSFPNAAHLEPQRGGCCTIMPYFIGKVVELPLTTTQDYSLLHILGESSIERWKLQIDSIRDKNGLVSFLVHPDYLIGEREIGLYKSLLTYLSSLRAEGKLWIALPREVDQWWRARNRMRLTFQDEEWRIEGEDSQRACVAFATLAGDHLTYSFGSNR
jgi:hypothetical protein